MNSVRQLLIPSLKDVAVALHPPDGVRLAGTLTLADEIGALSDFLGAVHTAAIEDKLSYVSVDVAGLTFVNSLAVRLFVDWAMWIIHEPSERRYALRFIISPDVTWQKTSVMALMELAQGVVHVEHAR